jgi:ABC-type cobalamin transport system ATPase subunit
VFSHVLLLKGGRVLAAGAREKVLASGPLAETFGAKVRLRRHAGRYQLDISINI